MISTALMNAIPILLASLSILVSVIMLHYRKNKETTYEKEIKKLRQSLLQGKLDRKSFLLIRDNLKVEDLFCDETQRLDNMLEEKSIDSETYMRMKKILSMTFNEKLEKNNLKYNSTEPNVVTKNDNFRFSSNC
jgi:hypothetical protein